MRSPRLSRARLLVRVRLALRSFAAQTLALRPLPTVTVLLAPPWEG